MGEDSTIGADKPAVLEELVKLLSGARGMFEQERVYGRAMALVLAELADLGRHTLTQLLRVLGATGRDWSAWYRLFEASRYDEAAAGRYLLQGTLEHTCAREPYVTVADGVVVYRSGKHVAGSSLWRGKATVPYQRGLQAGQRYMGLSWLTPEEHSYCRAIPLRWIPAVPPNAVPSTATPRKEWEAGLEGLRWMRTELDEQGRQMQPLVAVLDGGYDVQELWRQAPERTTLLIRTACNRKLYALPPARAAAPGPGRPPDYGERLPTPGAYLKQRKAREWTCLSLRIRARERQVKYRVVGPALLETLPERPLFLIVVRGYVYVTGKRQRHKHYRKPAHYLVTAVESAGQWRLPYPIETLLRWAWQRWECEVGHREMKSAFGIGEKQCWSTHAGLLAVQWGVWVYGLCLLAAYRAWGLTRGPRRSGGWCRHTQRWSFTAMWNAYREALWGVGTFRPVCSASVAKLLHIEPWYLGAATALADPGRI